MAENLPAVGRARTKIQKPAGSGLKGAIRQAMGAWGSGSSGGYPSPEPGTFETYRKMMGNPTIALARAATSAPIRLAKWTLDNEDDVPDDALSFAQKEMERLWPRFIFDVLFAVDFGFAAFEKVYALREDDSGNPRIGFDRIKPLLPEKTELNVDEGGRFRGITQDDMKELLPAEKCVLFTHDMEAGNLYGRSRNENCREVWSHWNELAKKESQFVKKVAGVIPQIQYPVGQGVDATGAKVSNFELAKQILKHLGQGDGVCMPNTLPDWAEDMARKGADISQMRAWLITFLEPGGAQGGQIVEMMRHKETLMIRGWLMPERAIVEGQFGTKAESQVHTATGLAISQLLLADIIACANESIIDPLLAVNYGLRPRSAWMVPEDLLDETKTSIVRIMESLLTNPANLGLLPLLVDVNGMVDKTGWPKAADYVSLDAAALAKAMPEAAPSTGEPGTQEEAAAALQREAGAAQ